MHYKSIFPGLLAAALLAACNADNTAQTVEQIKADVAKDIETDMNKAMAEVKSDLTDINVTLKDGGKASIAANGDLKINGSAIELDDKQRALTIAYFTITRKIALQGMQIGKESAKLATQAIGSAIGGLINGDNPADIEKSVEAKAGNIEAAATKLCDSALELKAIQEQLAAAVPQFTPEPMRVDRHQDGCSVNANQDIHLDIDGKNPEAAAAKAG